MTNTHSKMAEKKREMMKNCIVCGKLIHRRGMRTWVEVKEKRSLQDVTCSRVCSKIYTRIYRRIRTRLSYNFKNGKKRSTLGKSK